MPRLSASKLAAWISDYAVVALWQIQGLWAARRLPTDLHYTGDQAPVVILPGVFEPWTFMRPIIDRLVQHGHPVHVLDMLGYNTGAIPQAAQDVAAYIARHDLRGVILVAHSKGGLIGKYTMAQHNPDSRISRLIAIATPFSGSAYARLFWVRTVRDFSPTAEIIKELQTYATINSRITSIYPSFDPHIPASSHLDGAQNIKLPVMGHFRILSSPEVLEAVERATD